MPPREPRNDESGLTLHTLGEPSLVRQAGEREELLLDLGKPLALVAYLACAPGRTASREFLLDLLWADLEPEAAKHGVRQAVWHVRKRVGETFLSAERDSICLAGGFSFDRDNLLAAADRGDLEQVSALYRGDFFERFATPGASQFEQWCDLERARLRSVYARCLERLARRRLQEGKARDAIGLARRLRDTDPLHQQSWRLLIEALLAASDRLGAAVEAEALERLLKSEHLEQDPSTKVLLKVVRQSSEQSDEGVSPAALVADLVGREREFAAILDAWRLVHAGKCTILRVVSPPGLGKTRLLSDVHARSRAARSNAVLVRANPGAREVPYALAAAVAGQLGELPGARGISPASAHAIVSLNPQLSSSFPTHPPAHTSRDDELRHRMHALAELITAVADEEPLALFIDDFHWADPVSQQLLAGLSGLIADSRVLLVITSRGHAGPDQTIHHAQVIPLAPLSTPAVASLVSSLAELPNEPWAERFPDALQKSTAGSPLLVLETLQLLIQQGALTRVANRWHAADPAKVSRALEEGSAIQLRIAQLSDDERGVLSLLATAGIPLDSETVTKASVLPLTAVLNALRMLETRALVMRVGERWEVAHDEIASRAIDALSEPERRARTAAVGRALLDAAQDDSARLRLSTSYLRTAGDQLALAEAFRRFVRAARNQRDWRSPTLLAEDLLGQTGTIAEARALHATLPVRERVGLYTPLRRAAAAAILGVMPLGAMAVIATRSATPPPVAVLATTVRDGRGLSIYETPIDTTNWLPSTQLHVTARGKPRWFFEGAGYSELSPRPGRPGVWLTNRPFEDAAGHDLVLLSADKGVVRLTTSIGDDRSGSWSPDGEQVVFATGRWNELQHYDIAVLDLKTAAVRQLTSGDPSDDVPYWSPDGTRIGFRRKHWDGRADEVCVMRVDGSHMRCAVWDSEGSHQSRGQLMFVGWTNDTTLVVSQDWREYRAFHAETLVQDSVFVLSGVLTFSPNATFTLCECGGRSAQRWSVRHALDPTSGRTITLDTVARAAQSVSLSWRALSQESRFVDRVILETGPGDARVGISHHVRVRATDLQGRDVRARALSFSVSDAKVASVDSLGVVTPHQPGSVTIAASLGGWRSAQQTLRVVANATDTILHEEWTGDADAWWRTFGDPPFAVDLLAGNRRALFNRGDGRFLSGAHSAQQFGVTDGLALDAYVSTPISLPQWQLLFVSLTPGFDSVALASWDHRTADPGTIFPSSNFAIGACEFLYPAGPEGPSWGDSIAIQTTHRTAFPAPAWMRSGEWYRVRLQILPDGRCGVTVNGRVIYVSPPTVSRSPVHVFIMGSSVQSRIAVGSLSIFTGVPGDIDWEETPVAPANLSRLTHTHIAKSR